ncbi:MAG: YdcF family protein [Candidatus Entotheonellia bacterium]
MINIVGVLLERIYTSLATSQSVCPADLIFVLAGLPERKRYGWELFQRGLAPLLLLSVGRWEARFLKVRTGLPEDGNIVSLLPLPPEKENHIFCWVSQDEVSTKVVRLPEVNTFGEIAALAKIIREHGIQHILLISTDVHLRRIRYAVRKLFDPIRIHVTYVGVPDELSSFHRHRWWSRERDIWLVISEWIKLIGYHLKYGMLRWHQRYKPYFLGSSVRDLHRFE